MAMTHRPSNTELDALMARAENLYESDGSKIKDYDDFMARACYEGFHPTAKTESGIAQAISLAIKYKLEIHFDANFVTTNCFIQPKAHIRFENNEWQRSVCLAIASVKRLRIMNGKRL